LDKVGILLMMEKQQAQFILLRLIRLAHIAIQAMESCATQHTGPTVIHMMVQIVHQLTESTL
jgi:hypothetical protein